MLRRTKEILCGASGNEDSRLPDKEAILHEIKLEGDELQVYEKLFAMSREAMISYMTGKEDGVSRREVLGANAGDNGAVKTATLFTMLLR